MAILVQIAVSNAQIKLIPLVLLMVPMHVNVMMVIGILKMIMIV